MHTIQEPTERLNPKASTDALNPGSYLTFAIACRWISKITFVIHPRWDNDLAWLHFKDFDDSSEIIQLKKYNTEDLDMRNLGYDLRNLKNKAPKDLEPEVPFKMIPLKNYQNILPFDLIVVSQSPGFTTPNADKLLNIIGEYIR